MSTNQEKASWLAGLLSGWGIKESWAKIIAGAIIGGLVAAGVLYCDMRSMFHEQTEVNKGIATQISALNVRIEHKLEK